MTTKTTLDVKGLDHAEKEGKIFPGLEALGEGESLRIILDFNPVPLTYLLKAEGNKYDINYEKEGPDEWILLVTRRAAPDPRREQFRELLTELRADEVTPAAKEKARALFKDLDATTLGTLEQELIREGVTHEEIRSSLCDLHLDAIRDSLVEKRIEVQPPHPINTFMQEHVIILDNLRQLGELVARLKTAEGYDEVAEDLEKMEEIAGELVEAELHHDREEQALFPAIEAHDVVEPPRIMVADHLEFRAKKKELYQLTRQRGQTGFEEFKQKAIEIGEFLTRELENHIFKEDNILYQIALQLLTPEEWTEVKRKCDDLGYCCFTPEDVTREPKKEATDMTTNTAELDLRALPPAKRHALIFETWEALPAGDTLRITNDHDPKPLRYQFEAEYTGTFEWKYEQEGPVDWVVNIRKTR